MVRFKLLDDVQKLIINNIIMEHLIDVALLKAGIKESLICNKLRKYSNRTQNSNFTTLYCSEATLYKCTTYRSKYSV